MANQMSAASEWKKKESNASTFLKLYGIVIMAGLVMSYFVPGVPFWANIIVWLFIFAGIGSPLLFISLHYHSKIMPMKRKTILGLITNSQVHAIDELTQLSEIGAREIRTIIGELVVKGQLKGKQKDGRFEPIGSTYPTMMGQPLQPSNGGSDRIRTALQNLEAKYKNGEIEDAIYYKLKSEYLEKLQG